MAKLIRDRYLLGRVYRPKSSPNYYTRVRDTRSGKVWVISCRSDDPERAEQYALRWIDDLIDGTEQPPEEFTSLFRRWLALKDLRAATTQSYESILRTTLAPWFGGQLVGDISRLDVEEWAHAQREKTRRTSGTRRNALRLLRSFLSWAEQLGYARRNAAKGVVVRYRASRSPRALTEEEARRLVRASSEPLRSAILVALATGLRRRNIQRLRWSWINLRARTITVPASEYKTHREHTAYMPSWLAEHLREVHRQRRSVEDRVFPVALSVRWVEFRKEAGFPDLRLHDLRHTFATWLAGRATYAVLQACLGHSARSVTDRYVHVSLDQCIDAVERLPPLAPAPAKDASS